MELEAFIGGRFTKEALGKRGTIKTILEPARRSERGIRD
jgi:hypothetical protein